MVYHKKEKKTTTLWTIAVRVAKSAGKNGLIITPNFLLTKMFVLKYFTTIMKTVLDVKFCEGGALRNFKLLCSFMKTDCVYGY